MAGAMAAMSVTSPNKHHLLKQAEHEQCATSQGRLCLPASICKIHEQTCLAELWMGFDHTKEKRTAVTGDYHCQANSLTSSLCCNHQAFRHSRLGTSLSLRNSNQEAERQTSDG